MKVKSIWNRLYSIGQDYNMMTSFRTFKFFHSCLNVFGFQGLICCFNQNVPGTSLNEFNEHHMRCHGYLHIIAHWRLSFLWALGRACEEANCRLNPVFSTTQKVSLLNVLKMNKRTNVQHSPEIFVLNFLQDNIIFTVHMFDGHHMPTGTLIFTEII